MRWASPFFVFAAVALAQVPAPLRDVGIDQRLDDQVPLGLSFRDESGAAVELRQYFGSRPVVLSLVYYECPMLCNMVLNGLLRSMRAIKLDAGRDFEVVTVSFDPRETPALARAKKQLYIEKYGRRGAAAGWHFLTGDEASIRELARAVGFRYAWDAKTQQFAHASGIMVLTPSGRLSRYFYGVEYAPRDLRLGLVEASSNRIGTRADQFLLYCFHYDAATGKYSLLIMNVIRLAGVVTVLALVALVIALSRGRRKAYV